MIETHAHLYSEEFDADLQQVIERAIQAGVKKFYLPAIDSSYTQRMLSVKEKYPDIVFLMNGLHPCSVKENYKDELDIVQKLMAQHKFSAIGEIGIDLYWDKTFLKEQQEAFLWQIRLAKQSALPIVIHCREAFDEVFEILEQEKSQELWGIFHCFTGNENQAFRAIDCGMKLGIGGVVTYKNGKIDKFLKNIPLENIVLETDCPYLPPTPHRGKRNESSYLVYVADKLSDIYEMSVAKIIEKTSLNANSVFERKKVGE